MKATTTPPLLPPVWVQEQCSTKTEKTPPPLLPLRPPKLRQPLVAVRGLQSRTPARPERPPPQGRRPRPAYSAPWGAPGRPVPARGSPPPRRAGRPRRRKPSGAAGSAAWPRTVPQAGGKRREVKGLLPAAEVLPLLLLPPPRPAVGVPLPPPPPLAVRAAARRRPEGERPGPSQPPPLAARQPLRPARQAACKHCPRNPPAKRFSSRVVHQRGQRFEEVLPIPDSGCLKGSWHLKG